MPQHRNKFLIAVHLLLRKGDDVLLARRFQTGYEDGKYSLPAGHLEEGESLTQAMRREAVEEVGLLLHANQLDFAHTLYRNQDDERVDFFFVCTSWKGEPTNTEPEKCDELRWVPMYQLPHNTIPYIRHALTQITAGKPFSEFLGPVE